MNFRNLTERISFDFFYKNFLKSEKYFILLLELLEKGIMMFDKINKNIHCVIHITNDEKGRTPKGVKSL